MTPLKCLFNSLRGSHHRVGVSMDTLRGGVQGLQLTRLQQVWAQRGYAVPASGVSGLKTGRAVRALQGQSLDQRYVP
jgi:peptidoglycan hydrolase-like protein with peptidoglycan-binding domain